MKYLFSDAILLKSLVIAYSDFHLRVTEFNIAQINSDSKSSPFDESLELRLKCIMSSDELLVNSFISDTNRYGCWQSQYTASNSMGTQSDLLS